MKASALRSTASWARTGILVIVPLVRVFVMLEPCPDSCAVLWDDSCDARRVMFLVAGAISWLMEDMTFGLFARRSSWGLRPAGHRMLLESVCARRCGAMHAAYQLAVLASTVDGARSTILSPALGAA